MAISLHKKIASFLATEIKKQKIQKAIDFGDRGDNVGMLKTLFTQNMDIVKTSH